MNAATITDNTEMLQSSRRLIHDDKHRSALEVLSAHLDTYPNDLIARAERAALYMTLNRNPEMNADLDSIMSRSPKTAIEYDALGSALALLGFIGPSNEANDNWKRAAAAFEQSIRLDPNRADVFRHRAQMYVWQENGRAELSDLDRALALTPNDVTLLWRRAFARKELGNIASALADVNRMIQLEPDNASHYLNRAFLRNEEDYQGQLEDYTQALALTPGDAKTLNQRGLLYQVMEKPELAVQDYDQVLQLEPDNKDALICSAYALVETGNHQTAIKRFSQIITMQPEQAAWYGHRAKAYRAIGNIAAAEADEQQERRLRGSASPVNAVTHAEESPRQSDSSGDTQPGLIRFSVYYWLAWVWVGLALFTLVILLLLLNDYTRTNRLNASLMPPLTVGITAALYRGFRNGSRFKRESAITNGGMTGLALNLILWGIQIAIATVIWPFAELFRQIRFLTQAWTSWQRGEILVGGNQKPALCG